VAAFSSNYFTSYGVEVSNEIHKVFTEKIPIFDKNTMVKTIVFRRKTMVFLRKTIVLTMETHNGSINYLSNNDTIFYQEEKQI